MWSNLDDKALLPGLAVLACTVAAGYCYSFFTEVTDRERAYGRECKAALKAINVMYDVIKEERDAITMRLSEFEACALRLMASASKEAGALFIATKPSLKIGPDALLRVELSRKLAELISTYPRLDMTQCTNLKYLQEFHLSLDEHHHRTVNLANTYFKELEVRYKEDKPLELNSSAR